MSSSGEADQPAADADKPQAKPEPKHWLEYAIFVFVIATALATGAAAYYTRQQWLTAEDTEERGLRAYVLPKYIVFEPDSVQMSVENFGQTPAIQVKHFSSWETRPIRQREALCTNFSFVEKGQCETDDKSTGSLSPHDPMTTGNLLCDQVRPDAIKAQNGEIDLVLYGRITYADIFEKTHTTTFCDVIGPKGASFCNCHNEIDPKD